MRRKRLRINANLNIDAKNSMIDYANEQLNGVSVAHTKALAA